MDVPSKAASPAGRKPPDPRLQQELCLALQRKDHPMLCEALAKGADPIAAGSPNDHSPPMPMLAWSLESGKECSATWIEACSALGETGQNAIVGHMIARLSRDDPQALDDCFGHIDPKTSSSQHAEWLNMALRGLDAIHKDRPKPPRAADPLSTRSQAKIAKKRKKGGLTMLDLARIAAASAPRPEPRDPRAIPAAQSIAKHLASHPDAAAPLWAQAWETPSSMSLLCQRAGGLALLALAPASYECAAVQARIEALSLQSEEPAAEHWSQASRALRRRQAGAIHEEAARASSLPYPASAAAQASSQIVEHLGRMETLAPSSWLKWREILRPALQDGRLPTRFDAQGLIAQGENAAVAAHVSRLKATRISYVFSPAVTEFIPIMDPGTSAQALSALPLGSFLLLANGRALSIGVEPESMLLCWERFGLPQTFEIAVRNKSSRSSAPAPASVGDALTASGCSGEDTEFALCALTLALCAHHAMEWTPEAEARTIAAARLGAGKKPRPAGSEGELWSRADKLWIGSGAKTLSPWPDESFRSPSRSLDDPSASGRLPSSAPHWVKAHQHHYWTGPKSGSQKLSVRHVSAYLRLLGKDIDQAMDDAPAQAYFVRPKI